MSIYEFYKPLRNYLRRFELLESLDVVRAYVQYLQIGESLPPYIEFRDDILRKARECGINEWTLEILSKELILNAADYSTASLRSWSAFANAINRVTDLEEKITAAYGELYKNNILLELHRAAHRQFPWQSRPTQESLLRYFRIFSTKEFEPIFRTRIDLGAAEIYLIGLALTGHFVSHFGFMLPAKTGDLPISQGDVDRFLQHFSTDLVRIRQLLVEKQSYDQNYAYTFNPLRAYPLIRIVLNERPTLIAPLPPFLFRRFTEGIYYEVYDAPGFSDAFGRSFQAYVGDVLIAANRPQSLSVLSECSYQVGGARIECKTKKIRLEAKIGLDSTDVLNEDLEKMADFIVQVYKTLADAMKVRYPHWTSAGTPIFPVIVTLEEWYAFGDWILPALDGILERKMEAARVDSVFAKTYPYTICSVEDFESAIQVIRQTGIHVVMNQKLAGEHRLWLMDAFLRTKFPNEYAKIRRILFPQDWERIHPSLGIKDSPK